MLKKFEKKPVSNNQIRPLIEYLKDQNLLLDEVGKILYKEHNALKGRDTELITALASKKAEIMGKIAGNDQKIRLHPDKKRLEADYLPQVEVIKIKLIECKRRNEVNGKLIRYFMGANKRLTDVLMKIRDRNTKNMTYNDKGSTQAQGLHILNLQA